MRGGLLRAPVQMAHQVPCGGECGRCPRVYRTQRRIRRREAITFRAAACAMLVLLCAIPSFAAAPVVFVASKGGSDTAPGACANAESPCASVAAGLAAAQSGWVASGCVDVPVLALAAGLYTLPATLDVAFPVVVWGGDAAAAAWAGNGTSVAAYAVGGVTQLACGADAGTLWSVGAAGNLSLADLSISSCTTGAVVANGSTASLTTQRVTFSDNLVRGSGTVAVSSAPAPGISAATGTARGSCITAARGATVRMQYDVLRNSTDVGIAGGAVVVHSGAVLTGTGVRVVGAASPDGCGAGVQVDGATATLRLWEFNGCTAAVGGAVCALGNTTDTRVVLDSCTVSGSTSTGAGGSMYVRGAALLVNTSFTSSAGTSGGAIAVDTGGSSATDVMIVDSSFKSCSAAASGGALWVVRGQVTVTRSWFTGESC